MTTLKFSGVIPILATPFNDDESLDLASWQRMIEFMVVLGVDGITILGVLGESNRLSDHEREALIESAVATVDKRIPIVVGTSHSGSAAAAYLSRMVPDQVRDDEAFTTSAFFHTTACAALIAPASASQAMLGEP